MKHENSELTQLNRLFIEALLALKQHGATEEACRLAARGWSSLRHHSEREAERLNGALHALTAEPRHSAPTSTQKGVQNG
ncbi:MAG TPA: hypothetical protein VND43_04615 [Burkholderiales bacterium]|nr:hypothetical protein [Burkholderiales bacterium]